ncbi:Lrp/AsnC family transcriptional regulator [Roseateles sp. So40a]|uniref:Lrp/AsnC family transcriptional regulator n=1 Tax=Roseateles sp. So40a TaxID=3400226 RepID=UPI003A8C08B6
MASKNGVSGKTMRATAGSAASAGAEDSEDGGGGSGGSASGELDRYHVAILAELQREARLSNAELATRIGLSPAPTWRRVRWLEEQGFITGYRAEIDRRRLGLGVLAFVRVDADRNNGAATKELEEAIRQLPEVIACHYISGAGTFELEVMATDLDAFSRFSIDTLLNLPNVKDIHTSFSLGEVKAGGALPLGHLRPKG